MTHIKSLYNIREQFLSCFLIRIAFIILFIWLISILFAVVGFFDVFLSLLQPILFLVTVYIIISIILNKNNISKNFNEKKIDYILTILILLFSIINMFFFSGVIEGAHDPGVYIESSINLAKTGNLFIEDEIAITYPGFWLNQNGKITANFLPGYTIYLSSFYNIFGFSGFSIANSLLLFFGLFFLYSTGKTIRNEKTGIIVVVFFIFNFYTIHFSRATYTENLQFLLIWLYVFLFLTGYQKKELDWIIYSSLPLVLLLFVRLEAPLYILVYAVLLVYFKSVENFTIKNKRIVILISIAVLLALINYLLVNFFIMDNVSAVISYAHRVLFNPSQTITYVQAPYNEQLFLWTYLFYAFNYSLVFMAVLGFINFFIESKKMKSQTILILLLTSPQFLFLIKPSISPYLPWFMRRFWAVFLPIIFLLFAIYITNKKTNFSKHFTVFIFSILLVITISQSSYILTSPTNAGFLNFEEEISSNFNETDLVIFWDLYSYENYAPPLYFLYDTNVIYDRPPAMNPQLYTTFMTKYQNVYIVTSRKPLELNHPHFKNSDVELIKTLKLGSVKSIGISCDVRPLIFNPEKFKGYSTIKEIYMDNNPPTKIVDNQFNLNIFKLKSNRKNNFTQSYYELNYIANIYNMSGQKYVPYELNSMFGLC